MTGGEGERRGVVWRRIVIVVWLFRMVGWAVVRLRRGRNVDRRKAGCIFGWIRLRLRSLKWVVLSLGEEE